MYNLRGTSKSSLAAIASVLGFGSHSLSPKLPRSKVGATSGVVTSFSQCRYFRQDINNINRKINATHAWNKLTAELAKQGKISRRGNVKVELLSPNEHHAYKAILSM